jgi:tetratricopeptide (TPR) repeat protein
MASVWLARDLRHERPVALKVLHPELAGVIGVDRFVREVRLTARLQHPNILPVLDSGVLTTGDGRRLPWYSMPYLAGESLRGRLAREQQLPVETAVRITEEVAGALQAAHQRGIAHRDVKPENVMLCDGVAYVVDFGIAKALVETGEERLTSTGLAIGTPAYMSPEQASGGVVDARSDQYSLGCLLYEMLSGEPPFTGPTAQAIIARRLAEPPRPIRSVRPGVPAAVERAVLKALERVPADRFDSVSAFAAALRATESAKAAAAPRPGISRVALAGAVAAVAAGIGLWTIARPSGTARQTARNSEIVALYRRGVQAYDRRTTAGAREAVAAFSAALARDSNYAAAWNGLAQTYARAYQRQFTIPGLGWDSMLHLAVAAADRAVATDPESSDAWVTRSMVSRLIDPTDAKTPMQSARRAIALDAGNARAWHSLAVSLAELGDLEQALDSWRESVRRNPSYSQAVAFLAIAHYWRRDLDSAGLWADSAIALDPNYLLGRTTAGQIAAEQGDFPRAAAAFEAARRLSTDVELVNALAGRALVEAKEGDRVRARATLEGVDSTAGRYAPPPAHTAVYLAQAYTAIDDVGRALRWLERYQPSGDTHFQLHLRCDPPFDPIADDPRFRRLLARPRPPRGRGC